MRTVPTLKTNKLIIGYCLEALEYSKATGGMLLINGELKPHRYEDTIRHKKWNQLTFQLGMAGLTPIPSRIESMRVEENTVHVVTEFYKKIIISFEELHIFDMEMVEGLEATEEVSEYLVYDWFDIKRGAMQPLDRITGSGRFVNELVFYPSTRRDGNTGVIKDCYTKSLILREDLHSFESGETSARLAALSLLRAHAIKGPAQRYDEKTYHLNIVLEHRLREVYKNKKQYVINKDLPSNVYWCNILV